jgi:hypothetical protein
MQAASCGLVAVCSCLDAVGRTLEVEVLSKKRADLRANALLQTAREERERGAARSTRFLVLLFPQLSRYEPSKRWSVVLTARQRAMSRKHVRIAQFAVLVPAAAWLGALTTGWERSSLLLWIALLAAAVGQLAEHLQTRVELRAMANFRTAPTH